MNFEGLRARYHYLSDEQWLRFTGLFHRMETAAREVLLREGDIAKKAFWIERGSLRVWFNNNGKDTTFQFFFEGQGLASLESFRKNEPSLFTIETVEPCVLHWIHKADLLLMTKELEQYKEYNDQMLDFIFERQFHYMKEFLSFIRDTAAQRYRNLAEQRPHILQRVPQHYIASYLGITSVSLSRIRARLLQEKK